MRIPHRSAGQPVPPLFLFLFLRYVLRHHITSTHPTSPKRPQCLLCSVVILSHLNFLVLPHVYGWEKEREGGKRKGSDKQGPGGSLIRETAQHASFRPSLYHSHTLFILKIFSCLSSMQDAAVLRIVRTLRTVPHGSVTLHAACITSSPLLSILFRLYWPLFI
jgi:hypothetical protein